MPLIGLATAFVATLLVSLAAINNGNVYTHRLASRGFVLLVLADVGALGAALEAASIVAGGLAGVVA